MVFLSIMFVFVAQDNVIQISAMLNCIIVMPKSKKVPNENEYETFVGGAYFVSPPLYSHSSAPKGSFQREKGKYSERS